MKKFIFAVFAFLLCMPLLMGFPEIQEEVKEVYIIPDKDFYTFGQDKVQKGLMEKLNL